MKGKLTIVLAVAIIVIGFIVMTLLSNRQTEEGKRVHMIPVKQVKAEKVTYTDVQSKLMAYGRLNAKNKIDLYAEVPGVLIQSSTEFKSGNHFNKGQVIARIDDEEAKYNLLSMKSDFMNVLAVLMPDLKSDFPSSFNSWNNYLKDFDVNAELSELPEPASSKEKLFLASRNVFKTYFNIKRLEVQLDKYVIRAPFSGTLTNTAVQHGTMVRAGQLMGTLIGDAVYELELSIPHNSIEYVSVGNKAEVSTQNGSEKYPGKLSRINPNLDPTSQTVEVFIDVVANGLVDGMYMKAEIYGDSLHQVFKLPRKAVFDENFAFIIKDSTLSKVELELVKVDEEYVRIRGVEENTMIVTEPLVNISSYEKVKAIR